MEVEGGLWVEEEDQSTSSPYTLAGGGCPHHRGFKPLVNKTLCILMTEGRRQTSLWSRAVGLLHRWTWLGDEWTASDSLTMTYKNTISPLSSSTPAWRSLSRVQASGSTCRFFVVWSTIDTGVEEVNKRGALF